MSKDQMHVIKRNGNLEELSFDKILNRIKNLSININPPLNINYAELVMKIIVQLIPNISTSLIDELLAEQCAAMCTVKYDFGELASRLIISNHHKNTEQNFVNIINHLYNNKDHNQMDCPLISKHLFEFTNKHQNIINETINYEYDYLIDYFGFKTLERAYLMKKNDKIIECPQDMFMRVALSIHITDIDKALQTYKYMANKYFIHATPTLFNAGTPRPQLSSCYLLSMEEDSIDGIFNTLHECAQISKWAGGIGLHIHNIRASGTPIRGTNGKSNGLVPLLQVFNNTARYVDQGGGKRNGSIAIYLEPWHSDIMDWLDLKKNHGDETMRARDLFYGLWIPDKFMDAVKQDQNWYLMCPDISKKLSDYHGDQFNNLYDSYVEKKLYKQKIKARELWFKILDSQMETGTPYLCYKDSANFKSNQQNLGTIKSSNLCTEIIEYSDEKQSAVCNLASIGLSKFVENDSFNYDKLHEITKIITYNLNNVIDINYYPNNKTKISNLLHRPIGIGVQGLADTFALLNLPFCSSEAKIINKYIFETIYHASLEASNEIAIERYNDMKQLYNLNKIKDLFDNKDKYNVDHIYSTHHDLLIKRKPIYAELNGDNSDSTLGAYSSFTGSPLSMGKFQFNLWNIKPSERYDWDSLKQNIIKYGTRNSLLVAPMPTASTSQILGNNECFEPFTSNIYTRRTLAGEFVIINKYLLKDLTNLNIWDEKIKNSIIANKGSIQHIEGLDEKIKEKYKIVWEMSMKDIINMAADRGAFICQSQSLNLWCEDPNYKTLTSMHFHAWQKGLKTGIYYLRRKPKHQPQQFTINPDKQEQEQEQECLMCSA